MFQHEDDRRLLIEMEPGDYKACKVVIAKGESVLGDHYHLHKDERFLLVHGRAKSVQIQDTGDSVRVVREWNHITAPYEWSVPRGAWHRFVLEDGAILVGTATAEFDACDERRAVG